MCVCVCVCVYEGMAVGWKREAAKEGSKAKRSRVRKRQKARWSKQVARSLDRSLIQSLTHSLTHSVKWSQVSRRISAWLRRAHTPRSVGTTNDRIHTHRHTHIHSLRYTTTHFYLDRQFCRIYAERQWWAENSALVRRVRVTLKFSQWISIEDHLIKCIKRGKKKGKKFKTTCWILTYIHTFSAVHMYKKRARR